MSNHHQSTYSLLIRSEEKNRGVLEIALYAIFSLSTVISIWQFAHQPMKLPATTALQPTTVIASQVGTDTTAA